MSQQANERERFWVIWREGGGTPVKRHASAAEAATEAERLAKLHIDSRFYILESVSSCKAEATVTWEKHHEKQSLTINSSSESEWRSCKHDKPPFDLDIDLKWAGDAYCLQGRYVAFGGWELKRPGEQEWDRCIAEPFVWRYRK